MHTPVSGSVSGSVIDSFRLEIAISPSFVSLLNFLGFQGLTGSILQNEGGGWSKVVYKLYKKTDEMVEGGVPYLY